MPNHPIIDTHVHLWNQKRIRLRWIDGNATLDQRYDVDTFKQHTDGLNIEAMVYAEVGAEPHYTLLEVIGVEERSALEPRLKAVIAHAPLEDGDTVHTYLTALQAIGPRVKGIRRLLQGENDPAYCLRPGYLRGMEILAEFGYSFDICIKHHQLSAVVELVGRFPQVSFILDHMAKPDIRAGTLDPWREGIRALAAHPNVVCKISGMVTEADPAAWRVEQLKPYFEHVFACFGEDRVMYGGDWPVLLLASDYKRWVDTVDQLCVWRGLSDEAQRKLWNANARRVYRL
jgi:L-fuconolactonase